MLLIQGNVDDFVTISTLAVMSIGSLLGPPTVKYYNFTLPLPVLDQVIPIGLFRPKAENPFWRLNYVATNPAWADIVESSDRIFVIRPSD